MTRLFEAVYSPAAKIDKEAGIVRDVKILGRESRNRRTYSDKALDDAARLYEGTEVNIDHDRKEPKRERGLLEGFGVLKNVKRKDDGVYGDLHYLTNHPATPVFVERAERFPDKIGLSHNADGATRREKAGEIVESIAAVYGVDVVRNPATNRGLFESEGKTLREFLVESFTEARVKACGLLEQGFYPEAPMLPPPPAMMSGGQPGASGQPGQPGQNGQPSDQPMGPSTDDQIWLAFKTAVLAAIDDEALDIKTTLAKVGGILRAYDKLAGGVSGDEQQSPEEEPEESDEETPSEGDQPPPEKEKKPMAESVKPETVAKLAERVELLESENKLLKKQDKARAMIADAGLQSDSVLIESLVNAPDDDAAKRIIEREKAMQRPAPGRRLKPLVESSITGERPTEYPKDTKSFAAALR